MAIDNGWKIQDNNSLYKSVASEEHAFCGPFVLFKVVYDPQTHIWRMD
jgi:hypothetical protein